MGNLLLIGADGTIGHSVAQAFLEDGWQVWAIGRNPERFHPGVQWSARITDVSNAAEIAQTFEALQAYRQAVGEPPVEAFVYAVGDIVAQKATAIQPADWNRVLNANLTGVYLTTMQFAPLFSAAPHLFYIGALSERLILPGLSAYAAAKAGLEQFVQVLMRENPLWKITLVRPGAVATRFWERVSFRLPPKALQPDDVALRILEAYYNEQKGTLDLIPE